jgi:acylphosphatase
MVIPTTTVRVRIFVDGRVQGVGFRQNAAREAARLGLQGWIRNLPDGRVEAVYEGSRDPLDEMVAWSRRGPAWAMVTDFTVQDEEPKGERGFNVR